MFDFPTIERRRLRDILAGQSPAHVGKRSERDLNCIVRQLGEDPKPRPHAGKKSKRTTAREWL